MSSHTLKTGEQVTIGGGAAYRINGDAYPYTIIGVSPTGHAVTLQAARVVKVEPGQGFSEGDKRAEFEPDPNGAVRVATYRKGKRGAGYAWKGSALGGWACITFNGYATAYNPHV